MMGVSIEWANPEQIALLLTFKTPWTWDECEAISDTIQSEFESVSHTVDLIIDLQDAGSISDDVIVNLRDAYANGTSNLGCYIFVGAPSDFIEKLSIADHYFTSLGGNLNYECVDTLDEARRISLWKQLVMQYEANLPS